MASLPESYLTLPDTPAGPALDMSRPAAVVLPMPRVGVDGQAMIDHAAGGRLGAARGVFIGIGLGAGLWAGLLSLAWRVFH